MTWPNHALPSNPAMPIPSCSRPVRRVAELESLAALRVHGLDTQDWSSYGSHIGRGSCCLRRLVVVGRSRSWELLAIRHFLSVFVPCHCRAWRWHRHRCGDAHACSVSCLRCRPGTRMAQGRFTAACHLGHCHACSGRHRLHSHFLYDLR